jgi:hypothetical protein
MGALILALLGLLWQLQDLEFGGGLMLGQNLTGLAQEGVTQVRRGRKTERRLAPGGLGSGNFERKVELRGLGYGLAKAGFRGRPIAAGGQQAGPQAFTLQV